MPTELPSSSLLTALASAAAAPATASVSAPEHAATPVPASGVAAYPAAGLPIRLRPLTMDDEDEWNTLRWCNRDWLAPWDSGDPMHGSPLTFAMWIQRQRQSEANGTGALFAIERNMRIVGQISLGAISYGAMRTGVVGYWVDQRQAGHGFAPLAVAMLADWAFYDPSGPRLHRLEIAILPENARSKRVAEKLGAHYEGVRPGYMYINGRWRDHETYSLLAEDAEGVGFAARLLRRSAGNGPQTVVSTHPESI
ncbi:GNAT family N-acetyltransferase [Bifidobacterium sp. 82T10]|uniref:GNAT family N-acetyltransferase n=1 Tax=Bifidobacterium miconis TaxID=2834435 RepID=A0ABS6WEA5_9BIFI|nr:GNAT family protein [Bifidobacterium miconis]MBW3092381.1 GNAT family N-acetyltransferase [Bifidobacterium miconis]